MRPLISGCAGLSNCIDNGSCPNRHHKRSRDAERHERPATHSRHATVARRYPDRQGLFRARRRLVRSQSCSRCIREIRLPYCRNHDVMGNDRRGDFARMTRPEAIKWPRGSKARLPIDDDHARGSGATLVVACDPAFALEVSYRTREVIDRINRYFGYRAIAQLRVIQAPQAHDSGDPKGRPLTVSKNSPAIPESTARGDLSAALEALQDSVAAAAQRA